MSPCGRRIQIEQNCGPLKLLEDGFCRYTPYWGGRGWAWLLLITISGSLLRFSSRTERKKNASLTSSLTPPPFPYSSQSCPPTQTGRSDEQPVQDMESWTSSVHNGDIWVERWLARKKLNWKRNCDEDGEGLGGKIFEKWEKGPKGDLGPRETDGRQKQEVEEAVDTYLGIQKHVKSILALLSQEQKLGGARMKVFSNSASQP